MNSQEQFSGNSNQPTPEWLAKRNKHRQMLYQIYNPKIIDQLGVRCLPDAELNWLAVLVGRRYNHLTRSCRVVSSSFRISMGGDSLEDRSDFPQLEGYRFAKFQATGKNTGKVFYFGFLVKDKEPQHPTIQ